MSVQQKNRLSESASPYLRSAAHQPIDWFEWGEAAFERARTEDKPILLDIGAVWCHWCHVIDRESYENPDIARIINEHFVPVKVDRDERPDVDSRYQSAISAITRQGGWPLTGFLRPDGKPFYGGTYFPPEDRMGRPGFRRVLLTVAEFYKTKRDEVNRAAESIADAVTQAEVFAGARAAFDASVVDVQISSMTQAFDIKNGGFGHAPKFPHSSAIDLLLERYQQTGARHLLAIAETTLEKMARGGVYDQLAGGFHRYSVDERWLVPHFEKMSYDNSELLKNYAHAFLISENELLQRTAEGIVGWVKQVLSDLGGGFYASQDADYSLDDDGDYFTWTLDEVRAALSQEEARVIELCYDVEAHGEMHHNPAKNVLWIAKGLEEIASQLQRTPEDVAKLRQDAEAKLRMARDKRPFPFVDKTMYVAWNGMFASAYLEVARAFLTRGIAEYCGSFAVKTVDRMLREAWTEEQGFAHRIGGPALRGSLDDQIFGAIALLDAFEATLDTRYIRAAHRTMDIAIEKYGDAEGGGFFDRASDAPAMGGLDVRRKPFQDSPTPGANSAAVIALVRLHALTGEPRYHEWAERTLEAFAGIAPQFGLFGATYGLAATLFANHPIQVLITGAKEDKSAARLEQAAKSVFRFGKAVLRILPETSLENLPPALRESIPRLPEGKALALVCSGNTCLPPTDDPERLRALLVPAKQAAAAQNS